MSTVATCAGTAVAITVSTATGPGVVAASMLAGMACGAAVMKLDDCFDGR